MSVLVEKRGDDRLITASSPPDLLKVLEALLIALCVKMLVLVLKSVKIR